MEREERKAFERLLDNGYIDYPGQFASTDDGDRKLVKSYGFCYMPIMDGLSMDNDGAYKMMTERYLLKYFGAGHRLKRIEDMYVLKPYPAADADALVHSYIANADKLKPYGDRPWSEITHERWLVRTVGSMRLRDDGELIYDDSREGRQDWVYEQATNAYENDDSDPLDRPEDGWMWSELFALAIRADLPDPMMLTFALRKLRGVHKLRIVATPEGLRLRGSAEATTKFRRAMERLEAADWLREQMRQMRRRSNGKDGVGAIAGIEAGIGDLGRKAASAVRASDANDGAAGRAAEGVDDAL